MTAGGISSRRIVLFLKRGLLVLTSLLLIGCVAFFLYFLTLDQEDYKNFIINNISDKSGVALEITGDVTVDVSLVSSLQISDANIRSQDGAFVADIRYFKTEISLLSLLVNSPFFEDISLQDVAINIRPIQSGAGAFQVSSLKDVEWIFYRIKQANINKLNIIYHDLNDKALVDFDLYKATLSQASEDSPLVLQGNGRINNEDMEISGEFGSLSPRVLFSKNYPVFLRVSRQKAYVEIKGTIDGVRTGSGISLTLESSFQELGDLASIWSDEAMLLGQFDAKAAIKGDFPELTIAEINARLNHSALVNVRLSGEIPDVTKMEDQQLKLAGFIKDSKILKSIFPNDFPLLSEVQVSSNIAIGNKLVFNDVDLRGKDDNGLQIILKGKTSVVFSSPDQPFRDMELFAEVTSPTSRQSEYFIIEGWPEMGRSHIRATLISPSDKYLGIKDIDIEQGSNDFGMTIKGEIGQALLTEDPNTGIELDFAIFSSSTANIAKAFDLSLPEFGKTSLTGHFSGSKLSSTVDDINLSTTNKKHTKLGVIGKLKFDSFENPHPLKSAELKLKLNSPGIANVGDIMDVVTPNLGAFDLTADLTGSGNVLMAKNVTAQIGEPGKQHLMLNGVIANILVNKPGSFSGVNLVGRMNVSSTNQVVKELLFESIDNFGPLQGAFKASGSYEKLAFTELDFSLGQQQGLFTTATGTIPLVALRPDIKIKDIKVELKSAAKSSNSLTSLFDLSIPEMGRIKASANLEIKNKKVGLHNLKVQIGSSDTFWFQAQGVIDEITRDTLIELDSRLEIPDVARLGKEWTDSLPDIKSLSAVGEIKSDGEIGFYTGQINVGQTKITSNFSGSLRKELRSVQGKIYIPELYLADFGISPDKEKKKKEEKGDKKSHFFSREAIDMDKLKALDIQINLDIDGVIGSEYSIDAVDIGLAINNGYVKIDPGSVVYEGGSVNFSGYITNDDNPIYDFQAEGNDIIVGDALSQFGFLNLKKGTANIFIDLDSHGKSPYEVASNLNGKIGVVIENAQVLRKDLNLLAVDLVGWVVDTSTTRSEYANIDCAIFRADVKDGKLESSTLYSDSYYMTLGGNVSIDFKKEEIDMILLPKQKQKLWSSVTPVKIKGPLVDPSISAIPYETAAMEYPGYVLIPQIYIPAQILGYMFRTMTKDDTKRDSPCLHAEAG